MRAEIARLGLRFIDMFDMFDMFVRSRHETRRHNTVSQSLGAMPGVKEDECEFQPYDTYVRAQGLAIRRPEAMALR
jgi:hypothetical protein